MAHGLPPLPRPGAPAQAQTVEFGGLNYGTAGGAGELADCRNLSTREYPCLSQRPGRKNVEGYENVTAVYDYFGKLIVCAGGKLYMDGKEICRVSDGPKQFAVVNTQLVIWPDKLTLDLEKGYITDWQASVTTEDNVSTVYTDASVCADIYPIVSDKDHGIYIYEGHVDNMPSVKTYGKSREALLKCWTGSEWDWGALEKLEETIKLNAGVTGMYTFCDKNDNIVTESAQSACTDGRYAVICGAFGFIGNPCSWTVQRCIYDATLGSEAFIGKFKEGNNVTIRGGEYDLVGAENAKITAVGTEQNDLCFAEGTIRCPVLYSGALGRDVKPGEAIRYQYKMILAKTNIEYTRTYRYSGVLLADTYFPSNCILYCEDAEAETVEYRDDTGICPKGVIRVWDPETKTVYGPYTANQINSINRELDAIEPITGTVACDVKFERYTTPTVLTIQRSLPKLDYICASDNRLWGVSNEEKTIWASELGMPFNFYTYAGKSTDSYAVPVGSDGEFTGCCEIGDNVAFFKEDRIHLLIGKEPSAYSLYDYQYHGVAKGSCASMTVINEQLFYLGTDGVYVFSAAGSPQLISAAFGQRRFQNAVGGTDGKNYFISMQDSRTGDWGIWVFDAATGRWMQEDETQVLGFTNVSDKLYMVTADGELQIVHEEDSGEKVKWSATFCSIDETIHNRKCYSGLLLRYEADEGSSIKVEVKCDGGPWREVKNVRAESHRTSILPIRPNRCDSFQIRISGEGQVRLRSLVRKVTTGGLL